MNVFYIFLCSCCFSFNSAALLLKSNVTIQHLCEDQILSLQCSTKSEVIQVVRSMYGRTSTRICHEKFNGKFFEKPCANIEQSKVQTKLHCHGKSSCQIVIGNHLFTDPCGSNVSKHFEIHYRCFDRDRICPPLFEECFQSNDLKCVEKIHDDLPCQCPSSICQYEGTRVVAFIERTCPAEDLDGFHWPETLIDQQESLSCPSPCLGELIRSCQNDRQWSDVNAEHCQCPQIHRSNELSIQDDARSYVFQCHYWLIKMIWPKESSFSALSRSSIKSKENSFDCLWTLFNQFPSFIGIEFSNLALEISSSSLPTDFSLPHRRFPSINANEQIRIRLNSSSAKRQTMLMIHPKVIDSILLVQQGEIDSNVTLIFPRQSPDQFYQCRAYQRWNLSLTFDSSDRFIACRFECANRTHVICQCPYLQPLMLYVLHLDTRTTTATAIDYQLLMIENQCEETNEKSLEPLIDQWNGEDSQRAKKFLQLIDRSNENNWTETIKQIQSIGKKLISSTDQFTFRNDRLEIHLEKNSNRYENVDRSVIVSFAEQEKNFHLFITILRHGDENSSRISPIVHLDLFPSVHLPVEITLEHQSIFNDTRAMPVCVQWKDQQMINHSNQFDQFHQWTPDGCRLLTKNDTHSICSCQSLSSYTLLLLHQDEFLFNDKNQNRFARIIQTSSFVAIGLIIFTIGLLIIEKQRVDLTITKKIFYANLFFCLLILQFLYIFGLDQTEYKIRCRIIAIVFDYFLLASYSWMFVDQLEMFIAMKTTLHFDRIRLIAYAFYAYGFPLLILLISTIIADPNAHPTQICWASLNSGFLWPLVIPFFILTLTSFIFLIFSFCSTFHRDQRRFSLRTMSSLAILFGWTWLIAFVYHSTPNILIGLLFIVFNLAHSLCLFLSLTSLEKHLRYLWQRCSIDQTSLYTKYQSFLTRSSNTTSTGTQIHEKSAEHFSVPDNVSSSDYSSDLSSKQIFSSKSLERSNNEPPYLPSIPIHFLSTRLSTYRYTHPHSHCSTANEIILVREQHEQLLERHLRTDDEHQYYEIR